PRLLAPPLDDLTRRVLRLARRDCLELCNGHDSPGVAGPGHADDGFVGAQALWNRTAQIEHCGTLSGRAFDRERNGADGGEPSDNPPRPGTREDDSVTHGALGDRKAVAFLR